MWPQKIVKDEKTAKLIDEFEPEFWRKKWWTEKDLQKSHKLDISRKKKIKKKKAMDRNIGNDTQNKT